MMMLLLLLMTKKSQSPKKHLPREVVGQELELKLEIQEQKEMSWGSQKKKMTQEQKLKHSQEQHEVIDGEKIVVHPRKMKMMKRTRKKHFSFWLWRELESLS